MVTADVALSHVEDHHGWEFGGGRLGAGLNSNEYRMERHRARLCATKPVRSIGGGLHEEVRSLASVRQTLPVAPMS